MSLKNSNAQVESLWGENLRPSQQRKLCGWCLVQATQSSTGGQLRVLSSTGGSITLASSDPDRGLQSLRYLLEKQQNNDAHQCGKTYWRGEEWR